MPALRNLQSDRTRHQRHRPVPGPGRARPVGNGLDSDRCVDGERAGVPQPGHFVELYWVLRRAYWISTASCAELVEGLLDARELRIDRESIVRAALTASRGGLDFADALIAELGRVAGCDHTVTFDRRAAQSNEMRLLATG